MGEPRLEGRHRDRDGEIRRRHGNTLVRTLRRRYGMAFAPDAAETAKLGDILGTLDPASLAMLMGDRDGAAVSDGGESIGTVERVIRVPRRGWAEDARTLAAAHDDVLVWPEFANDGDHALVW